MPRSMVQDAELPCPQCDQTIRAAVWIVVDADEEPDLAARACAGTLHDVTCENCGALGAIEAPLLYHDAYVRRLIYAAPSQTSPDQDREIALHLAKHLLGEIEDQSATYLHRVEIIPGIESLGPALDQLPPDAAEAVPPSHEEVAAAINALLEADSEVAFETTLADHPAALHPSIDELLAQLIAEAQASHDMAYAGSLRFVRERLLAQRVASTHSIKMLQSIQLLLEAPSSEIAAQLVKEHAAYLLAPEACDVLSELARAAEIQGDEDLATQLRDVRDALQSLQAGGQDVRNN